MERQSKSTNESLERTEATMLHDGDDAYLRLGNPKLLNIESARKAVEAANIETTKKMELAIREVIRQPQKYSLSYGRSVGKLRANKLGGDLDGASQIGSSWNNFEVTN